MLRTRQVVSREALWVLCLVSVHITISIIIVIIKIVYFFVGPKSNIYILYTLWMIGFPRVCGVSGFGEIRLITTRLSEVLFLHSSPPAISIRGILADIVRYGLRNVGITYMRVLVGLWFIYTIIEWSVDVFCLVYC